MVMLYPCGNVMEPNHSDEPEHNTLDYHISTHLENYRHVEGVRWDNDTVAVAVSNTATGYDEDAIIGTLVRHFGLEFHQLESWEESDANGLEFHRQGDGQ